MAAGRSHKIEGEFLKDGRNLKCSYADEERTRRKRRLKMQKKKMTDA